MSTIARSRVARLVAGVGAAAIATVGLALPAFGHASFPSSAVFGFQPNTLGGTGAEGVAPPYPAGTTQTLFARVPDENSAGDSVDGNVAVDVIVPAGWTSPVCGQALTNTRSVDTNDTNQPGTVVGGWGCVVQSNGTNQVLHFTGPAPASKDAGAQFFSFQVTVPSPSAQTTYDGAAGSGTEGFIVDQYYEGGDIVHWYPNDAYPGNPPEGAVSELATGLARTVAAAIPEPPVTPVQPVTPAAAVAAAPAFTG